MGIKEPIVNLCKKNATFRKLTRKTMNVIEGTKYRIFSNSSVDDKTLGSFSSLYSAVRALPMDEQSRMFDMVERGEFSISCR